MESGAGRAGGTRGYRIALALHPGYVNLVFATVWARLYNLKDQTDPKIFSFSAEREV